MLVYSNVSRLVCRIIALLVLSLYFSLVYHILRRMAFDLAYLYRVDPLRLHKAGKPLPTVTIGQYVKGFSRHFSFDEFVGF